jgi:AraC family transcriptional regulator of adaptative response / DNA-3-methyladenine glycosylase II
MDAILGLDRRALDRARLSRDPRFDGKFFIAVTTTRIYCRPVCPVPSPRSTNVRYYASAAAAAEDGYRPCLRCRPEAAPGTPAWLGTSAVVRRALRLIQEGALDEASVDSLAASVGIGPRHLHRLFVEHVGASPLTVAHTRRLHFAKRLLDETSLGMAEIASAAGFGSLRRFNQAFQTTYRRAPRDLRRQPRPAAGSDADEVVLRLAFRPPYDWAHLRDFLGRRALPGLERVDERGYARTLATESGHATVCVRPLEGEHALPLRVRGAAPASLFAISSTARRMFDLAADPARISAGLRTDTRLGPLLRHRPGLRIPGAWDPFECAVRAVLGQQVTVDAGVTLASRLVARLGRRIAGGDALTHLFPSPAALAAASLEGLGMPAARAAALRALAEAVVTGAVDFQRPADEVIVALQAVRGIGRWTAQYVALRALGEPDAFPDGDLVLRAAAGGASGPLSARALAERAEAWQPWRGYAVLHLWAEVTASAPRASGRTPRRGRGRPPQAHSQPALFR